VNGAVSRSSNKETVLTSITGGEVNIGVDGATTIKGATIAAVDAEGNDNGNLSLETDTLEVSSLNNTKDSKAMSASVSGGGTVSVDASADNSHSKTKTLATLGNGNVDIADKENSDIAMLNRDIADNEVDIYDIESHKGLKGSLDTRLLTESGRNKIAEDVMKSGMIVDTVRQIVTDDTVGITEFFNETDKQNKTYEAVKAEIAKNPSLAKALQNPDLTAQEKEGMLNGVTDAVMVSLGYETHDNKIIAKEDDARAGFISTENGNAYINDGATYVDPATGETVQYMDSTGKLVMVAGHEASHAIDAQGSETYAEGTRENYATNFGENLTDFTDMALGVNGYDGGTATTNSHTGNRSEYVSKNNEEYDKLDKTKGDDFIPIVIAASILYTALTTATPANAPGEGEVALPRSDLSSPGDDVVTALAARAEQLTGVPADTLELMASLNPKDLAKLGIKNVDDLIKKVQSGDVSAEDLKGVGNKPVAPAKRDSDTVVLGKTKNPNYGDVAKEEGFRNFDIPTEKWNKMTETERWSANEKFLDRAIAKQDKIKLSHNPHDPAVNTGAFKKEIEYLTSKGYKLSKDGTHMVHPK